MKTGGGGAKSVKTCDIAKSAFFTLINALFSPGSIEISSFTTATQAFEEAQNFSYFLFPMNDISVSLATSSCSGAVIFVVIEPTIVPLRS